MKEKMRQHGRVTRMTFILRTRTCTGLKKSLAVSWTVSLLSRLQFEPLESACRSRHLKLRIDTKTEVNANLAKLIQKVAFCNEDDERFRILNAL